jgi:isoleucyl-tRNA synthetase
LTAGSRVAACPVLRFFIHLETRELEDAFPADFIAEGIDQTRGWYI